MIRACASPIDFSNELRKPVHASASGSTPDREMAVLRLRGIS